MERLFSPCTRLHDLLASLGRGGRGEWIHELNLDISTDDFLSAERAFTYADLYAMLEYRNTVLWLTPHAIVVRCDGRWVFSKVLLDQFCRICFNADGQNMIAWGRHDGRSPEHTSEICDVVLRLSAASVVHSVDLQKWNSHDGVLVSAPTLAFLMEQCQSLETLTLKCLQLDENHCRVLGAYSRPGLEIELIQCRLTNAGTSALAEVLGRNQGPTKLDCCDIDYSVLANGLRGNGRLKSLRPRISGNLEDANRQVLAIASALRENRGLIELVFGDGHDMSDETWGALCDSLKAHPTLQVLNLCSRGDASVASAVLKSRIQVLLDMMKVNISIHTIDLDSCYSQHELFRSVIPFLETNRHRSHVRAIQQTRPIPYRTGVLGRALLTVRTDPNRFWMLLSGNAEVAFPSASATTTPVATILPTPATGTPSVGVSPVAATASTTSASNTVASAACQKRKACP
jgi:hypothetical protein